MRKTILLTLLAFTCLIGNQSLNAQSYEHSAGVRLGNTSGLTYKKFLLEEQAIEVLLSGRNEGIQVSVLYVTHKPLEFSFNQNFFVYYGVGGHIGLERFNNLNKSIIPDGNGLNSFVFDDRNYFAMGVDGIVGIEYRWLSVPITISFDIKPYFNYIGMRFTQTKFWDASLSFKYIF